MPLRGSMLLLWLGLAVLAQISVAIFGVFSRSLQMRPSGTERTKADPPIPALRLLFLVSLLAIAFLVVIDACSWSLAAAHRWRRQRQRTLLQPPNQQRKQAAQADIEAWRASTQLASLSIAVSMALAGGSQLVAPGFVDAAIVQLVNTFGVLLVVFVQAFLLGHRLPLLVYPCAALTVAGAAMVIVPSIGQSGRGGLDSGRAWLGFGLSILSMLAASAMYILLQAFRRLKLSGTNLQYQYLSLTIIIAFPLTMAVDGTDWAAGFGAWDAGNWAELVLGGTVIYVGQNYLLQHTTWQLGAPLVSMLYGLRLVASILLSKAILSYTVIETAVQIVGAVLTVSAVTAYMGQRWWASQQQQAAPGAAQGGAVAEDGSEGGEEAAAAVTGSRPSMQRELGRV
ncbi:hypothetical protein ABPG75_008418 [Micractinium tetrahymenae]